MLAALPGLLRDAVRPPRRRLASWTAALALLCLGLSLAGPGGPVDLHNRLEVAAFGPGRVPSRHGWGAAAWALLLGGGRLPPMATVAHASAVAGALLVPASVLLGRVAGLGPQALLTAALLLATLPLHLRLAHAPHAGTLEVLLLAVGALLLVRARRSGDLLPALGAAAALGAGASMRPEGLVLDPVLAGLALLLDRHPSRWRRRQLLALGAGVLVLAGHALVVVLGFADPRLARRGWNLDGLLSPERLGVLDPAWVSLPWLLGLGLALALPLRPRARWTLLALVALGGGTLTPHPHTWGDLVNLRYGLRALPWAALLAGAGLAAGLARLPRRPALVAAVAAGTGLALAPARALVPTTIDVDDRLQREVVAALPEGCTVLAWEPGHDLAHRFEWVHLLALRPDLHLVAAPDPRPPPDAACVVWYRGPGCWAWPRDDRAPRAPLPRGLRPECRAIEARLGVRPLALRTVEARPAARERYAEAWITIGSFRVVGAEGPP